jgi:hypothetical protein
MNYAHVTMATSANGNGSRLSLAGLGLMSALAIIIA